MPKVDPHCYSGILKMVKQQDDPDWDEFHDLEIVNWKRVRSAIEHENQLTNHRLTWLLSSQAFLFAAFALVFQASTKSDVNSDQKVFYQLVLAGFSLTGILVGIYIQRPLRTAEIQHDNLRDWWYKSISDHDRHPPICGDTPNWRDRFLPPSRFPLVFVAAWIIFVFGVLGNIIISIIKPYSVIIGILVLGLVGALGLVSFGVMIGRRQSNGRPPRP
ncbi:MAG: hypothetical protein EWV69_17095 [Microcystis panniformis Mp_MB_F_20080800_S26]|nr:MAG: hypothetical protein EWV69_17095 [Microcystis panniformis Mp_MB_F_20080800_S26]